MRLETRKYLYDVQRAAALLREFTVGKTFADYERDAEPITAPGRSPVAVEAPHRQLLLGEVR